LTSIKWWHAQLFLGWHTVWHYLKKLWPWRARHGLKQFRHNYVAEGASRYSETFRKIAFKAGQCTTCGMCDALCPKLGSAAFVGPMRLVASGMRGGTLSFAIEESLKIMTSADCLGCGLCESTCPEKIPMRKLSEQYLAQIEEVRAQE
jgi:succinate dehydrogenase/fumarate reductase-like Fe-S protein